MCELTSAKGILYKITQNSTDKSYIGQTEKTFSSRYNIKKDQLKVNKVGYCLVFDNEGNYQTALSNKLIIQDIIDSPDTVEVDILEKDIYDLTQRIKLENKYIEKYGTIFNGYNTKISVDPPKKPQRRLKIQDFDCIKPEDIEYDIFEVFEQHQQRQINDFIDQITEKNIKMINSARVLPKNKEDLALYLENIS